MIRIGPTEKFQGNPCKRAPERHKGIRYKSTRACVECVRENWMERKRLQKLAPESAA